MPYDPRIHQRRSIRLKGHDYTQPGAYFITLCTQARQCLFGNVVKGKMQLNYLCHIAFNCWEAIPDHFPHIELDTFVVMPNHLHGILVITDTSVGAWHCHAPTRRQYILDNPQRWADDPENPQHNPDDCEFLFDIPF
ncbi:transposase [Nostoc sp.]|uniref:transposase n=1 Tax=Nostoc sp. TaxID=1180 RepID=UPI002FF72406